MVYSDMLQVSAPYHSKLEPELIEIEASSAFSLPGLIIVGLASQEINEAKERIRSALSAAGLKPPNRRVTINLSPANLKKHGTGLDLPIALAILGLNPQTKRTGRISAWSELGLNGALKKAGMESRTLYAVWQNKVPYLLVDLDSLPVYKHHLKTTFLSPPFSYPPPQIIGFKNLPEIICWLAKNPPVASIQVQDNPPFKAMTPSPAQSVVAPSLAPTLAMPACLKRAILIASLGSHHILILGPKGSGKTRALEWFKYFQPQATTEQIWRHHQLKELRKDTTESDSNNSPNRIGVEVGPHHRPQSLQGWISGERWIPGGLALAHGGLFIADELPEWARDTKETLRGPLETGKVIIHSKTGSFEIPTQFQFIATGNLCPCGGWPAQLSTKALSKKLGFKPAKCRCSLHDLKRYMDRISGPLLDRIDLCALIQEADRPDMNTPIQTPETLLNQIETKRNQLQERFHKLPGQIDGAHLEEYLAKHPRIQKHLNKYPLLSLRSRHKTLRIALTIAVLNGKSEPSDEEIKEAFDYRPESLLLAI